MSLKVESLIFRYKENPVLDGISFEAAAPEVVFILGRNGAGKSTLFKCVLGLLDFHGGSVELSGRNIKGMTRRELARKISYIPQSQTAVFPFTAGEIVLMGTTASLRGFAAPGKKERESAERAIEAVGITELSNRRFSQLSGGERQLVYIARAIAQQADIMLMDEPCSSLDYGNQVRILQKAKELSEKGYLILISTHNPDHAFAYGDKALLISEGKLLSFGSPGEALSADNIEKLYNIKVELMLLNNGKRICIPYA